jgi:hypothetical protein
VCAICGRHLKDNGGLIYFRKRPSDIAWQERMDEKKMVGHPPYAEWFCDEHYEIAKQVQHLAIDEACKIIRSDS